MTPLPFLLISFRKWLLFLFYCFLIIHHTEGVHSEESTRILKTENHCLVSLYAILTIEQLRQNTAYNTQNLHTHTYWYQVVCGCLRSFLLIKKYFIISIGRQKREIKSFFNYLSWSAVRNVALYLLQKKRRFLVFFSQSRKARTLITKILSSDVFWRWSSYSCLDYIRVHI